LPQHPVGCSYDDIYDFMNCEEENPCWGWLNSDRVVRMNTTKISNSLNDVYQVSGQ
jgi:acyloxyacyl hydrolase